MRMANVSTLRRLPASFPGVSVAKLDTDDLADAFWNIGLGGKNGDSADGSPLTGGLPGLPNACEIDRLLRSESSLGGSEMNGTLKLDDLDLPPASDSTSESSTKLRRF
jgi:hypothetical protein